MENIMLPKPHRVLSVQKETKAEYTFRVAYDGTPRHGQFFMLSIPKVGEAPKKAAKKPAKKEEAGEEKKPAAKKTTKKAEAGEKKPAAKKTAKKTEDVEAADEEKSAKKSAAKKTVKKTEE